MLTIVNGDKLTGTELTGAGPDGPIAWHVSGIGKHLHHYIIYLTRDDNGWERKIKLDRYHSVNQTGIQYKLECGTEHMHLYKSSFLTIDIFKNFLEYFI
jgi:hypothetical protein